MNKTGIEFLDYTWNPIAMRCTRVSEGCEHCWHLAMCKRLAGNPSILFNKQMSYKGANPYFVEERLDQPRKLKKHARIGVQFMGDLFHEDIRGESIGRVFGHIAAAYWHTFLVLTKRTGNMREFSHAIAHYPKGDESKRPVSGWPPNAWAGVSVELQKYVHRIEELLQIPAAVRFLSLEPLLGELHISEYLEEKDMTKDNNMNFDEAPPSRPGIDWVIIGGLSLPGGKVVPPNSRHIDNIVVQCDLAGVPVFIKDNAQYLPERREFPKWTT